jgi:hypothetical protein
MSELPLFVPPSRLVDDARIVRAVFTADGGASMELWDGNAWVAAPETSGLSFADLFIDGTPLSAKELAAAGIAVAV